jgi:hypothetical protein
MNRYLFEERQSRDEFAVFGEYVANKVRKISNRHANNTTQFLINKILYNAEMGLYDEGDGKKEAGGVRAVPRATHYHRVQSFTADTESALVEKDAEYVSEVDNVHVKVEPVTFTVDE